jgi:hypothetical protein
VSADVAALAAQLLVSVHVLLGLPLGTVPAAAPVSFVPAGELSAVACRGNCALNGVYHAERGILLNDRLDPLQDPAARAVLLHELVHHVQHVAGRQAGLDGCRRFVARETEAYKVENAYRQRHQLQPSYGLVMMMQTWSFARCEDAERER